MKKKRDFGDTPNPGSILLHLFCHCFENGPFSSFVVLMAVSMADSRAGGNPVAVLSDDISNSHQPNASHSRRLLHVFWYTHS